MTREESLKLASYKETPYYYQRLINKIYDEFEELEIGSCIGCVNSIKSNSQDCISCSRQYQDNFKIIKNKDKTTNI